MLQLADNAGLHADVQAVPCRPPQAVERSTSEQSGATITCDDEGDGDRKHADEDPDPDGDAIQLAVLHLQHAAGRL